MLNSSARATCSSQITLRTCLLYFHLVGSTHWLYRTVKTARETTALQYRQ